MTSIIALLPTLEQGVPWASDFTWSAVNYTPIVVGAVLLAITIWWFTSAKKLRSKSSNLIVKRNEFLWGSASCVRILGSR